MNSLSLGPAESSENHSAHRRREAGNLANVLGDEVQGVEEPSAGNNGSPMLVVMEDRDVASPLRLLLNWTGWWKRWHA